MVFIFYFAVFLLSLLSQESCFFFIRKYCKRLKQSKSINFTLFQHLVVLSNMDTNKVSNLFGHVCSVLKSENSEGIYFTYKRYE